MTSHAADIVLAVHFLWLVWMVSGLLVALIGFAHPRVWGWHVFRTLHLVALAGTATVPFWASQGVCPLTLWESHLQADLRNNPEPLLVRLMSDIVYWDVTPWAMSIATGFVAVLVVIIYFARPPWRFRDLPERPSMTAT